ncbi:MAG: endonuclease III [Ignavibacteriales bacterium]|nr:MAG: endonuclease III [Ignavibacteriales bacterium]
MADSPTIRKINSLLLKRFGKPYRAPVLPDPIDLLIATVLSQNTNDKNSYKAYKNLKDKYKHWHQLKNVPVKELTNTIRTAGLANQKAETIKKIFSSLFAKNKSASLEYLNDLNNEDTIKELTKIKGVGVKTASCVLLFAMDRDICPVDTHVHRTLNRIGIVKTTSPDKAFFEINKNFPLGIAHSFHTNLLKLGRGYCKANEVKCITCPLIKVCNFEEKSLSESSLKAENSFMLLDNV